MCVCVYVHMLSCAGLYHDLLAIFRYSRNYFFILFYHDVLWLPVERAKMNAQILQTLKPGGTLLVIDHSAEAGSGTRDARTLHRGDARLMRDEITAAGFEFVSETDFLRNPEDDLSTNVFMEGVRGKTDRFVLKFRKPVP